MTPDIVCVWRHAEHTVYGVQCTLLFLQCRLRWTAEYHRWIRNVSEPGPGGVPLSHRSKYCNFNV